MCRRSIIAPIKTQRPRALVVSPLNFYCSCAINTETKYTHAIPLSLPSFALSSYPFQFVWIVFVVTICVGRLLFWLEIELIVIVAAPAREQIVRVHVIGDRFHCYKSHRCDCLRWHQCFDDFECGCKGKPNTSVNAWPNMKQPLHQNSPVRIHGNS